jgi:hypothetical protein
MWIDECQAGTKSDLRASSEAAEHEVLVGC